jgi:hypothetical protein
LRCRCGRPRTRMTETSSRSIRGALQAELQPVPKLSAKN